VVLKQCAPQTGKIVAAAPNAQRSPFVATIHAAAVAHRTSELGSHLPLPVIKKRRTELASSVQFVCASSHYRCAHKKAGMGHTA